MESANRLDLWIKTLVASVLLGLIGNLLLRDVPWGIGFSLYTATILAVSAYLYRRRELPLSKSLFGLVPPALLFASMFAWRDATALKLLNGLAILLIMGLAALRAREGKLAIASVVDYPFRLFARWFLFVSDFGTLVSLQGRWNQTPAANVQKAKSVARGVVLAAPAVILFGALFASADSVFERLITESFSVDLYSAWSNVAITGACTWLIGGFFTHLFLISKRDGLEMKNAGSTLGTTEVAIVLGSLNILFAAFVLIQVKYFFGGAAVVSGTEGLTYAEYARRGFFELVAVAGLSLPLLLGMNALLNRESGLGERVFNGLSVSLVLLLFVVMASAAQRMQLYVSEYGISQLRLYVFAAMTWLALVFGWFLGTVVRGHSNRFAFGALSLFLVGVFALNVINPDALVARVNLARTNQVLDADYLLSLSSDAAPEIVRSLPLLKAEPKQKLKEGLAIERERLARKDWRSWTLSGQEAKRSLSAAVLNE